MITGKLETFESDSLFFFFFLPAKLGTAYCVVISEKDNNGTLIFFFYIQIGEFQLRF